MSYLFLFFLGARSTCSNFLLLCFITPSLKPPKCLDRFFLCFFFEWCSQTNVNGITLSIEQFSFCCWTRLNAHTDGPKSKQMRALVVRSGDGNCHAHFTSTTSKSQQWKSGKEKWKIRKCARNKNTSDYLFYYLHTNQLKNSEPNNLFCVQTHRTFAMVSTSLTYEFIGIIYNFFLSHFSQRRYLTWFVTAFFSSSSSLLLLLLPLLMLLLRYAKCLEVLLELFSAEYVVCVYVFAR